MKKTLVLMVMALLPALATAGGDEGVKLDPVSIDLNDKVSLQRGARIFVNYCLSCHSAGYMRYNRMARDLEIPEHIVKDEMLFAADKIGDLMKAVMPREDAKDWFGVAPPDLTLVARSRGPEWIYTYMRGFYLDDSTPSGWNNVVFQNVAMPHVLYEWQGLQRAKFEEVDGVKTFAGFELVKAGTKTPEEYDRLMRDLTNFFVYLGEPAKLVRYRLGWWVLAFLAVFFVVAYLLKKEYWKDVH